MHHISPSYDVIIVGAGPAGSACAGFLARAGVRTLLLDRARFPRAKACGEYTSPASAAIIERLGATGAVEAAGMQRHRGMTVVTERGLRFTVDYSEAGSQYASYATERAALDNALACHAVAMGADFRAEVRVEALLRRSDTVVSGVRTVPLGDIAARWVIGADGAKSTVARLLGVTRRSPLRRLGLAAHYVGIPMAEVGEMHVAAGDYCALNPLADGVVNVSPVVNVNPAAVASAGGIVAFFEATLRRFPLVAAQMEHAHRISPVRGVGPMASAVSRTADPGWMLIGDAAGFYDPFTGEGVHSALRSAELAAEILITALAAAEDPARTARHYRQARRREFTAKRHADQLVQLFVRFPWAMRYVAPHLISRPHVRARLAALMGGLVDPATVLTPRFFWQLLRP